MGQKKSHWLRCKLVISFLIVFLFLSSYLNTKVLGYDEVFVDFNTMIGQNELSLGVHDDFASVDSLMETSILSDEQILTIMETSINTNLVRSAGFKLIRVMEFRLPDPSHMACKYWYESTKTGTWDWTNVDAVIAKIFEAGAEPLITLGDVWDGKQRNMPKGMAINPQTNLAYSDSWAAYCKEWVKHFQLTGKPVRYYEIINEPWLYFGWNDYTKISYYMNLFNTAAQAMRQLNANLKLGFDGTNRKPVLDYWLSNGGANLDFIDFHKYDSGAIGDFTEAELLNRAETFQMTTSYSYYGIKDAKQKYYNSRGKWIPVIDGESNFNAYSNTGSDPRIQQMFGAVWTALVLRTGVLEGLAYNVYYCYSSSASYESQKPTGGYGFGLINSDNDQPWYPYYVNKFVGSNLIPGDNIVKSTSPTSNVRSLAWLHNGKRNILIIGKVTTSQTIYLSGISGEWTYSKIDNSISWKTPTVQTGKIQYNSPIYLNGYTVLLLQQEGSQPPVFEDDFESGSFSKWSGTSQSSGETTAVEAYLPYKGTYHGRFSSNGGGGTEQAYCYKTISETELYARGYFIIRSGLPLVDQDDRFYFMRLTSSNQYLAGVGIRLTGGVTKWVIHARTGSSWSTVYATSPNIEMNRYYCVELHWKKHSSAGLVEVYIDGVKVSEITGIDTTYYGNAGRVDVGLMDVVNVQNAVMVYGDAFVLSHSYVGPGDDDINEIQLQITSSNDNAWYYEDTGWRMDGSFYLGCDQPSYERESTAYRWRNVNIPKGATIISAEIKLYGKDYLSGDFQQSVIIKGLLDSASFSSRTDLDSRKRTSAQVSWKPVSWGSSYGWHSTPDISSLIQELINQSSWQQGGSIAIDIKSTITGVDIDKAIYSYAQGPNYSAILEITWK
jgi:hypothetical protein